MAKRGQIVTSQENAMFSMPRERAVDTLNTMDTNITSPGSGCFPPYHIETTGTPGSIESSANASSSVLNVVNNASGSCSNDFPTYVT